VAFIERFRGQDLCHTPDGLLHQGLSKAELLLGAQPAH
jgi:hypothetical protein